MSERRQWKFWASSQRCPSGHTVLRDEREAFPDEPGHPVTVIEGHEPVYTLVDVERAYYAGAMESGPADIDADNLMRAWRAHARKTLEGE